MTVIGSSPHAPEWDTVVVGAGLGGLSTAAFLATNGQRVLVLEQHEVVGGSAQVFRRGDDAYEFDVGVHHVGECEPGGRMRTLTDALGIGDRIEWRQLDPDGFSTITLPGLEFRVPVGWEAYTARLVETFPAEEDALRRCLGELRTVADGQRAPRPGGRRAGVRRWLGRRTTLPEQRPLAALLEECALSPAARLVVAGECGGYGAPPSRATVGVHAGLLDHLLVSGAWYPRGGGQVLPARLAQTIEAHGGEIRRAQVDRILVEEGQAVGVTLPDGTEIHAGAVVSNTDPRRTYLGLVGREHLPSRLLRRAEQMRPALSLVSVHLVLDLDLRTHPAGSSRWVHPHPDLEAAYADAYEGRISARMPVFMTSGTAKDPTGTRTAPAGRSTLTLVAVAPATHGAWRLNAGGPVAGERYSHTAGYLAAKEQAVEAALDTASLVLPGLRDHVVHLEASTPVTQERYTLASGGSAYGLEVARDQVGPLRPGVRTPIPGLFLTGAGTRHMHGVLATVSGGAATAGAVLGRDLFAEMAQGRTYGRPDAIGPDGEGWDPLEVSRVRP